VCAYCMGCRFVCDFRVDNPLNSVDVRVEWLGNATLDVASVTLSTCCGPQGQESCGPQGET
jgi:hypothetical protein